MESEINSVLSREELTGRGLRVGSCLECSCDSREGNVARGDSVKGKRVGWRPRGRVRVTREEAEEAPRPALESLLFL